MLAVDPQAAQHRDHEQEQQPPARAHEPRLCAVTAGPAGSRRYPPSVNSRFRRADDAFERGIERMVPRSWGVKEPSRGSSLIGLGLAWIIGSTVLLVVSLLTDRAMLWPVAFLVVGLLALPTGIWLNRRSSQ